MFEAVVGRVVRLATVLASLVRRRGHRCLRVAEWPFWASVRAVSCVVFLCWGSFRLWVARKFWSEKKGPNLEGVWSEYE